MTKRWILLLLSVLLGAAFAVNAQAAAPYVISNDNNAGERYELSSYAEVKAKLEEIKGRATDTDKYTLTLNQDLVVQGKNEVVELSGGVKTIQWTVEGNGFKITKNPQDTDMEDKVIIVGYQANAVLNNVVVDGQNTYQNIYVAQKAKLTLGAKTVVQNGRNNIAGTGGVHVSDDGTVIMEGGSQVVNNHAGTYNSPGGGIRMEKRCTAIIKDGALIKGNSSTKQGGGISALGDSNITIGKATIEDNVAKGLGDYGGGGALFMLSNCKADIDGAIMKNNSASHGGAIYINNSCKVTVKNTEMSGNEAGETGGGIYSRTDEELLLENNKFLNNTAYQAGGGVVLYGTNRDVASAQPAIIRNCLFDGNNGTTRSGAIDAWVDLTVDNCTIKNNVATMGGAICAVTDLAVTIKDSKFDNNTADEHGGALALFNDQDTPHTGVQDITIENTNFSGNTAVLSGGAISAQRAGALKVSGSTFTANKALPPDALHGLGGAIFTSVDTTAFSADNCTFTENQAGNGGAMCLLNGGTISGSTLQGNVAIGNGKLVDDPMDDLKNNVAIGYAGGLSAFGGTFTVQQTIFSGNKAEKAGGGMMVWPKANVTVSGGSQFKNNNATLGDGGAINVQPCSYKDPSDTSKYTNLNTSSDTVFQNNTAVRSYAPPTNMSAFNWLKYARNSFTGTAGNKSRSLLNNADVNYRKEAGVLSVPLNVQKKLAGGKLKADDFAFTLSNASGKLLQTVRNRADGSVVFTPRTFSNEGSFTFVIKEVDEGKKGVTYDKTVYRATIKVKNGGGEFTYRLDWEKDGVPYDGAITFNNRTKMPATGDSALMLPTVLTLTAIALLTVALYQKKRREQSN